MRMKLRRANTTEVKRQEREFKKRLEEKEENEEADILSFTFHRHDLSKNRGGHESFDRSGKERSGRKEFNKDRKDFGGKDRKDRKDFKRGGKREFGKKDFGGKKRRFDDDED